MLRPAPRVPFNGTIGPERRFGWAEFSFGEFRHVKSVLGGTINDVVLAVIAGGLGRYLRALGLPTDGVELRAMCPVSMRRPDQRGALGNLVSMIFAPLHVGILDPVARLTAEREAMERLKNQDQAGGLYEMTNLLEQVPPALAAVAGQLSVPNTLLNTVSTNVPGPQIPLFLSGQRLIGWYPLLPLAGDVGLCNAILTYDQRLTIGVTTDPRLVPDVWLYVECLKASFAELARRPSRRRRAAPRRPRGGAGDGRGPARHRSPTPNGLAGVDLPHPVHVGGAGSSISFTVFSAEVWKRSALRGDDLGIGLDELGRPLGPIGHRLEALAVPGERIAPELIEQVALGKARQGDLAGGLEGRRLQLEVGLDALAGRRGPELHELADHPLVGLGISRHSVQNLVLHGGGGLHCASPSLLRPPPAGLDPVGPCRRG